MMHMLLGQHFKVKGKDFKRKEERKRRQRQRQREKEEVEGACAQLTLERGTFDERQTQTSPFLFMY